ncbi:MAG TPA: DNA polymerase I [Bacteroidetes bacterium]|nr:DNA polymerase I [Bacteroidota bacterium]
MNTTSRRKLYLVDGSALAYRSHFAFARNPLINSRGENTSAIFGFVRELLRIIDDEQPDYLGVVFDTSEPTFRHKAYPEYKATREKMPEELREQLPRLREVIEAMHIPIIEVPGYEADDALATLARKAADQGIEVYLATGDKDLMQIISPQIKMSNLRRDGTGIEIIDPAKVREKMGVPPEQIVDYLALVGDSSDNVPGVPKVGKKRALELLQKFGSLEAILRNTGKIEKKAIRESLQANEQAARLSQKLVTLDLNAPIELDLDRLKLVPPGDEDMLRHFRELEFHSLVRRFQSDTASEADDGDYHTVRTETELRTVLDTLKNAGYFTFDLETTSAVPMLAEIVGLSFSCRENEAWYVPVRQAAPGRAFQELLLDSEGGETVDLLDMLSPLFQDEAVRKNAQNAKYDIIVLANYGVQVRGLAFDTMVASYLLNPSGRQHNLDALALEYFNIKKIPTSDLIGKGKKQITMREVALETVARYACEDADITERLRRIFEPKLAEAGLRELADTVEIPLILVLVDMERNGVALDQKFLEQMSAEMHERLQGLEQEIYDLAGEEFNIQSTKQLAVILFEKLGLPVIRRTKTGYSTDAAVLEKLASIHPLPACLLEYREIAKLKSTYVDALPRLINPRTGRVHTSYNQTVAATGRLSSSDPNLQNIPIRTEIGRSIRRAFVPGREDWLLLDADYSQIELRIMAHLSGDEALVSAFRDGDDIHTATAARVFGVEKQAVDADLRRRAKEINFGIMYGMGVYGLASRLQIPREEARAIIDEYFLKYPGVNAYIARTLAEAREKGYVTTLMNRRRYLPEIQSSNRQVREFAERTAINTPIQGSAADLIKLAMINLSRRMKKEGLRSLMIMQVHDELVFEVPEDELETMRAIVRQEMEEAISLNVPIVVDVGVGKNWLEAH